MANHSELRYGVAGLAKKVFTPAHMRDDPKMIIDRAMRGGGAKAKQQVKVQRYRRQRRRGRRGSFLSGTFRLSGRTVFTTCVS